MFHLLNAAKNQTVTVIHVTSDCKDSGRAFVNVPFRAIEKLQSVVRRGLTLLARS